MKTDAAVQIKIKDGVCAEDDCNDNDNQVGEVLGGTLSIEDGTTEREICAGDGQSDAFEVILIGFEGNQSAWIITDDNGNILTLPSGPPFDLEGAGAGTCLIYYISYEGTLTGLTTGANLSNLAGCL